MTLLPDATAFDAAGRHARHDGWTPERQRAFLEAIAEGLTVERACRLVQMTVSSAYALKQRAAGQSFALGWRAANLIARERVADDLLARAMDGQTQTVTRPDGSTWARHSYDNRTALALLNRLDRMVESAPADPAAAAQSHAARVVAQDWEAYLTTLEADDGPARAGLFLARRTGLAGAPAAAPALEPVLALARADRFCRTGASVPEEVDTRDLDPGERAGWTAEQWLRAEAAGLLRIAPAAADTGEEPPLPPLVAEAEEDAEPPVRWDERCGEYRTHLPPCDGEVPRYECGHYGESDYERTLTEREQALVDRALALDLAARHEVEAAERDAWFAAVAAQIAKAEGHDAGPLADLSGSTPSADQASDIVDGAAESGTGADPDPSSAPISGEELAHRLASLGSR